MVLERYYERCNEGAVGYVRLRDATAAVEHDRSWQCLARAHPASSGELWRGR